MVATRCVISLLVVLALFCTVTAASATTPLAKQVLVEINLARTDPHAYAGFLREFRKLIRGKSFLLPGTSTLVYTDEGVAAVDEAIHSLEKQKPLSPLVWSSGLADAAAELVIDGGATGDIGHTGRRSGGMKERIERHGVWSGRIAENISYGYDDARLVVMQLLVDDGVPDRGHRKNLFDNSFGTAGVACGSHRGYDSMCVIDFAGGFRK
jgi:uncharacterized protein YkwD